MRQTTRSLLALSGLVATAAAVGLYAWRGVYAEDQAKAERTEHELKAISSRPAGAALAPDAGEPPLDFTRLTVTTGGQTSALEKDPAGTWRLTAPVAARADQAVVEGLVSQLKSARFKAALDEHPDAATLARYGLDRPRFSVEAQVLVGEARTPRTLTLTGGIDNPFDGSVFVRRDGQEAVYAAEGALRYALARSAFELRDKQVLALDEQQVQALELQGAKAGWALARDADGRWTVTRPYADLAEAGEVSALLAAAAGERALSFPGEARALLPLFAHPALTLTATLKDGGQVVLRLARPPGDAGDRWYALRDDASGPLVAEVGPGAPGALEKPAAAWRDRTVLRFEREAVARVVLHGEGPEVVLVRRPADAGPGTWELAAPLKGPARAGKVSSLLWALGGLRAAAWAEAPKDWRTAGVGPGSRFVSLEDAAGAELARLTLGKPAASPATTTAVRGSRPLVAQVETARLEELPFSAEALLEAAPDAGP